MLCAGAAGPVVADVRCPAGDAYDLVVSAERALARADWPLAARRYGCAVQRSEDAALAERATRSAYDNYQLVAAVAGARRWLELAPQSEVARRFLAAGLLRLYDDVGAARQFAVLLDTSARADTPEQMARLIKQDVERWGKVVRQLGIKLD